MHSNLALMPSFIFPGMRAIYQSLFSIYRESNPLVISTVNKIWQFPNLNTNEILDYIFIYLNAGSPEEQVCEHWHYVTLGLSDLYGDSRIHAIDTGASAERLSGFGIELTFRLKKHNESQPPSWPATLLQQLAKYVFVTRNKLLPNDYLPWNKPLDGIEECKIRHMLVTLDCQLKRIKTPLGHVSFCQIVGVTDEELNCSQSFNVKNILEVLKQDQSTGGISLITDMTRKQSVFDLFPQTLKMLEEDLEREGSDLAGVNGEFFYRELPKLAIKTSLCLTMSDSEKSLDFTRSLGRLDIRTSAELAAHHSSPFLPFARQIFLDGVEIIFTPNSAKFLKLAFKYRLFKGHHFTFQSPDTHLTFLTENVSGSFVTNEQPYGLAGKWLQIRIEKDFLPTIINDLTNEFNPENTELPKIFDYPEKNLRFIINNLAFGLS
ncbi:hypothetical protein PVAND_002356 [Polypedilum vanderplanki]|uniref:Uncharacterized protein n=1 Tax=Polypedilum vanderplanki TaxID=319348 RepID=A0A9J6BQR3_POLVA|nr:hypothetical protein PVAND_002356 [Polypedilum vanderplanki]